MVAKGHGHVTPTKTGAFKNRQQDDGWGRAVAHLLPVYPLIYAWTRRTVTPLLHVAGGSFLIGIALGLATPEMNENKSDALAAGLGLVATPLLAKAGIDRARRFGAQQLNESEN